MKKIIILMMVAMLLGLGGCRSPQKQKETEVSLSNRDWINIDVVGAVTEDMEARPQDDYALAVNKDYILSIRIPEGRYQAGGVYDVSEINDKKLISLLTDESQNDHDAMLVKSYYEMMSDWEYRDALGTEPLMKYIEKIRGLKDIDELTDYLEDTAHFIMSGGLLRLSVMSSFADPDSRVLNISGPGFTLEDADEYRQMTENGKIKKDAATAVWTSVLSNLGFNGEEVSTMINNTFKVEMLAAEHSLGLEKLSDPAMIETMWNPMDLDALQQMAGSFPIAGILKGVGISDANLYNVEEIEYLKSLQNIFVPENVEALKDYLTIMAADSFYSCLDRKTRDEAVAAYNEVMGIEGTKSDEEQAMDEIYNLLIVPVDNMYIRKYCTKQLRDDVTGIIHTIIDEYHDILNDADWLSEETRKNAIEKLDNMRVRAVYPDELGDWSGLNFNGRDNGGNLVDAHLQIDAFKWKLSMAQVNEKVDKDAWLQNEIPTSVVNAFYNPQDNSINICAGILNDIIYQDDFSYEQKLGTVGTIVGHEISHGFDPMGSQFNKDGAFESWWTDEDRAAFNARSAKLIAYYDALQPLEGVNYSGNRVQGEAIADLGGMKCVLAIAKDIEGFDYKSFFEAYAKIWAVSRVLSNEIDRARTDSHPLGYLRINVPVQQFEEFYEAYDVKPGDGMYLPEDERICVW